MVAGRSGQCGARAVRIASNTASVRVTSLYQLAVDSRAAVPTCSPTTVRIALVLVSTRALSVHSKFVVNSVNLEGEFRNFVHVVAQINNQGSRHGVVIVPREVEWHGAAHGPQGGMHLDTNKDN